MRFGGIAVIFVLSTGMLFGLDNKSEKAEENSKQLIAAATKLAALPTGDDKAAKDLLKFLESQTKSRDSYSKYVSRHALALYFFKNDKLNDAWKAVKDCTDEARLQEILEQDYGTAYLRCYLDAAVCKLRRQKPQDALQMLYRAESLTHGYDKVLVQLKYAEVMLTKDVNQVDKAAEYLKLARTECDRKIAALKDDKAVAGQAKAKDESLPQWEALRKDIDRAAIELDVRQLAVKYGDDYGNYVKMRKLYRAGLSDEAQELCLEIIKSNKGKENVYIAAAKLLAAKCVLKDRRLELNERIKKAEMALKKFIKDQPYGLYRGEAWMELGRIELEQNWDADAAAKNYGKALEWFRYIRNLNDAMEIYAVPDKVKDVSKPQGKYTSLDQWKRTVYRAENEREIINQKTASWYLNEKEKECIFLVGFFMFLDGKYDQALALFKKINSLDSDIAGLESKNIPNLLLRLRAACEQQKMIFNVEERRKFKGLNKLKMAYAEMEFGAEKFAKAKKIFEEIAKNPKNSTFETAAALIGVGFCNDMLGLGDKKEKRLALAESTWKRAYELGKGTSLERYAIWMMANYLSASTDTKQEAIEWYELYLKKYPHSENENAAKFSMGMCYFQLGDYKKMMHYYRELKAKDPEMMQVKEFERILKLLKFNLANGKFDKV